MKKLLFYFSTLALLSVLGAIFLLKSFTITNTKPEDCEIITVTITEINEGSSNDIVFRDNATDSYYINRGLERGLNLDSLKTKVLNKTVILHLAKIMGGDVTSEHISQLNIGKDTIFTEF